MSRIAPFRQPQLKPQDVAVAVKLALPQTYSTAFRHLGKVLHMSYSEVHSAVQRCELSLLLTRETGFPDVNKTNLREFLVHGLKYAFPALVGAPARGIPTGIDASPLRHRFQGSGELLYVWPDPEGDVRGLSVTPLYAGASRAARGDTELYTVLALLDVLRIGAARERKMAADELARYI